MAWIKIDDNFSDHPKVLAAGPLAAWLHTCALCYAGRYLTDGLIPSAQVRKLADVDNPDELASRLVEVGLWETVEGGYRIHDYLRYNPSGEAVRRERETSARRQSEWRERHRGNEGRYEEQRDEATDGVRNSVSHDVTNAHDNASVTSAPSPSPSPSDNSNSSARARFYQLIEKAGVLMNQGMAELYEAILEDIVTRPDPLAFMEALFREAADVGATPWPKWLRPTVRRCIRENCMPGQWRAKPAGRRTGGAHGDSPRGARDPTPAEIVAQITPEHLADQEAWLSEALGEPAGGTT